MPLTDINDIKAIHNCYTLKWDNVIALHNETSNPLAAVTKHKRSCHPRVYPRVTYPTHSNPGGGNRIETTRSSQ